MCIIVIKDKNVPFPSESTLSACWDNNSDGAGFMYAHNGMVHIAKGFMNFDNFVTVLNSVRYELGDDIPYIMHFRIATHGDIIPGCTHPFPVHADYDVLRKLTHVTDIGFVHNGILSYKGDADTSDTMEYIRNFLTPLVELGERDITNGNLLRLVSDSSGYSKFAMMNGDGNVYSFGEFQNDGGVLYSNATYSYTYTGVSYNPYEYTAHAKQSDYETSSYSNKQLREIASESLSVYEIDKLMNCKPSKVCNSCPDVTYCVYASEWGCKDRYEAENYVTYIRDYLFSENGVI